MSQVKILLPLPQLESLCKSTYDSAGSVGVGVPWATLAGVHVDTIIHLACVSWLGQRILSYLISGRVEDLRLIDPLPDSVGSVSYTHLTLPTILLV